MKLKLLTFLKDLSGATAIEYALIAAIVSVAIVGGATAIGTTSIVTLEKASKAIK